MNLHFICTGNVFRSRIAESYTRSVLDKAKVKDISVTSSGIMAAANEDGPIAWYAAKILKENNLLSYVSPHWTQTTARILQSQDFIVFLQPLHFEYCRRQFGYQSKNYLLWNIPDMPSDYDSLPLFQSELESLVFAHNTFLDIKSQVSALLPAPVFSLVL